MTDNSVGARVGSVGTREPRLFGYCGRGDDAGARALANIRTLSPGCEIVGTESGRPGKSFTAFGLVADDAVSVGRAATPDGSFLLLDGHLLENRHSEDQLLDRWLDVGNSAFEEIAFSGSLVAWNAATATCILARDPHGRVPLFFSETSDGVVVATDLATLTGFGIAPIPNPDAIDAFVTTGHFPAPLTPLAGIAKLPPGHFATVTSEGASGSSPWAEHFVPSPVSEADARELMAGRFEQALHRSWEDDDTAAVLLSGGIDSALILVGITQMLKQPARAFTFRYEDYDGPMNEGRSARRVADHLGVPHEEIPVRPLDVLSDLDAAVRAYGEPFTWSLHTYHLGPIVDRGIATVFSGAGGDASGLTRKYKAAIRFNEIPSAVGSTVRAALKAARPLGWKKQATAEWIARRAAGPAELYSQDSDWSRDNRRRLYQDPKLPDRGARQLHRIYNEAVTEYPNASMDQAIMILTHRFNVAEQGYLWQRQWPNAFGLRSELPYLDNDYYELATNIEGDISGKDLQRELGSRYLPRDMAYAPKLPQQMPVNEWLRGSLATPARERLSDLPKAMTSMYDPDGVTQLLDAHIAGRHDYGWQLIGLLTTAAWFGQLPK